MLTVMRENFSPDIGLLIPFFIVVMNSKSYIQSKKKINNLCFPVFKLYIGAVED